MRAIHKSVPALVGIILSLGLVAQAVAADKRGRLSGSVMNMNKDKSEITIRNGTAGRVVEYTNATTFTNGSVSNAKAGTSASSSDVNLENYLTCVGAWDGVKLAATNCMIRPSKKP
jgi:hypothetical protein